jgi:anaerobic sulfite reductase subunit B
MNGSMLPIPYRIVRRRQETTDTATLVLQAVRDPLPDWGPGQFMMIYAFGVGEIPISISGGGAVDGDGLIHHTVRTVGAVSGAVCAAPVGTMLGLRGPFGCGWPAPPPAADVLILAGGIGLAPLRPVVLDAIGRGQRVAVLIGARTPADLIFTDEYPVWREAGAQVLVTVDRAPSGWDGRVGVVTTLLDAASVDPAGAVAYVCGPEVMMRRSAEALAERCVTPDRIQVSLERAMRCGVAVCGHCQLGPLLICRDGPVTTYDRAEPLLATREL